MKRREGAQATHSETAAEKREAAHVKPSFGERLTRNLALSTLLLLCVAIARDVRLNNTTVLEAAQRAVQSEWDENVGKLTYVSSVLSDSIAVFAPQDAHVPLCSPVAAQAAHAWTRDKPYAVYYTSGDVYAAAEGEVTGISHTDGELYSVRLYHNFGLETLYFGLIACDVREGDTVRAGTKLGTAAHSEPFAFAARRDGVPLDTTARLSARE